MNPTQTKTIEVPDDISPDLFTNPFILSLLRADNGDVVRQLGDEQSDALSAACAVSKKAKIVLSMIYKPMDFCESGTRKVAIIPDIKVTIPKGEPSQTVLFNNHVQGINQLVPFDPQQAELLGKVATIPIGARAVNIIEVEDRRARA